MAVNAITIHSFSWEVVDFFKTKEYKKNTLIYYVIIKEYMIISDFDYILQFFSGKLPGLHWDSAWADENDRLCKPVHRRRYSQPGKESSPPSACSHSCSTKHWASCPTGRCQLFSRFPAEATSNLRDSWWVQELVNQLHAIGLVAVTQNWFLQCCSAN